MSTLAWNTVADALVELPPTVLKSALLLYNRYRDLNSMVPLFGQELAKLNSSPPQSPERTRAERQCGVIVDIFNTSIDSSIEHAKTLSKELFTLAKIKPHSDLDTGAMKDKVDRLFAEREERVRRLNEGK